MKRARGFSLIELVVTIVIATIIAAIAIPSFTDSESKATWFHEQVKAGVRYAQRQAVAQRRAVYVVVQASQVQLCYDPACPLAQQLTQIATGAPYTLTAPSGVTITATTTPFSFNGLGQPSPIAGVSLSVGGKGITVTAETGYVQ